MAQFLPSWYKANAKERNHGTNIIAEVICHGDKLAQGCLVQCRGTNLGGVDNMSRHRSNKRAVALYPAVRLSGCLFDAETICKNCDKKMTTTVRVTISVIKISILVMLILE